MAVAFFNYAGGGRLIAEKRLQTQWVMKDVTDPKHTLYERLRKQLQFVVEHGTRTSRFTIQFCISH